MLKTKKYSPIGIAGAASVGKDTLCNALINNFMEKYALKAERLSIGGDFVRKDLGKLLLKNLNIEINTLSLKEKAIVRPLMVEYARYLRNKTKGRYFIDKLNTNKQFGKGFIPIIPDIRYAEYHKDELYWLKNEKKGILVFLERNGVENANEFEQKNNIILKSYADFCINVPNFKNISEYPVYMEGIIDDITQKYILPLSNGTSFGF